MEALYAKLYDKYTKLKENKFSEFEDLNKDQEEKFVNYVSVAEEMMECLKKENQELRTQNNQLRIEVESISCSRDKQSDEYHKLLMEERQKISTLTQELERLQNLQQNEGLFGRSKDKKIKNVQLNSPEGGAQVQSVVDMSNGDARTSRKRRRHSLVEDEAILTPPATVQPECSRKTIDIAGGNDNDPANSMLQFLVECLLGMKISVVNQNEGICFSALHESSGYLISLAMVKTGAEGETELQCRVISLGTLATIAPECMREDIIISKVMCPIFFERVSRAIKLA